MSRTRIGIIGCGVITRLHMGGYKVLADAGTHDFEIAALCSRNPKNADQYRGSRLKKEQLPLLDPTVDPAQRNYDSGPIGARDINKGGADADYVADWRDLVARDDLDLVEILTPPGLHAEIALAALDAGKHVFVEKPLALTVASARRVVERAAEKDRRVAVGLNLRFDPRWRAARWILDTDRIGGVRVFHAQSFRGVGHWSAGFGSMFGRVVGNLRDKLAWRFPHLVTRPKGPRWRYQLGAVGAGELAENGVHLFDFARYLGGDIDRVGGVMARFERDAEIEAEFKDVGDVCDTFLSMVRFREGGVGQISLSRAAHGESIQPRENFLVHGDRGSVSHERYTFDNGKAGTPYELFLAEATKEERERLLPRGITHRFAQQKLDMLDAIATGRAPEVDGEDALLTQAACYAVAESSLAGREIAVADVLSGEACAFQDRIAAARDALRLA